MTVYYAIGDIHGLHDRLTDLHAQIRDDIAAHGGPWKMVHVGDLIDRGPDSRAVVEQIMRMQADDPERVVTLKGNHEELMLHAYDNNESAGIYWWATNGGDETINSYQLVNGPKDDWRDAVDSEHVKWIRALPVMHRDEARGLVFVHGGIDPKTFPNESDEIRLWTRSAKFFRSERWPKRDELKNILVIHGHTPTQDFKPEVQARRVNVDTGACFGGPLTAVVLAPNQAPRFLEA